MSKHSESIETLYQNCSCNVSPHFKVFDYIIKNYISLNTLNTLVSKLKNNDLAIQLVFNSTPVPSNFSLDMLSIIDYGDIHLSYLTQKCKNLNLIIKVFHLYLEGKTLQEIASMLRISRHTIIKCRFIAANTLAETFDRLNCCAA